MSSDIKPEPHASDGKASKEVFVVPASTAQQRFWLLEQLKPGNAALNVPLAARLAGRLDRDLIERAVNHVIRRHEILRTSFRSLDNEVVQVVANEGSIALDWRDISGLPEAEREQRVRHLMLEEGARPFPLSTGPLIRGVLIKLKEDAHVLLLTMHHIVCDGWSLGILLEEVAANYTRLLTGEPPLPELPLQYADFAQWQTEWLKSPAAAEQRDYWKSRLTGNLPTLNAPTDRTRRSHRSFAADTHTVLLSRPLSEALLAFCQRESVTPFMLFFSAYALILHRFTTESDVVIGTPAANRGLTDLEGLIGLFSNPLLLRLNMSGNLTFRDLLARVKEASLGAFDHCQYPFEKLLEEIQTDTRRHGSQWLRYYFLYQRSFTQTQRMPELVMEPMRAVLPGALFEWTLIVLERPEGISLNLEYNTGLFDLPTIERLLQRLKMVLETAMAGLDTRIDRLPMLLPAERKLLLDQRPGPSEPSPRSRVHELFELQAVASAQAPALCSGENQWTYSELDTRANQLARFLLRLGLPQGGRVGLAVDEDSPEFVRGFLAILKAGGCAVVLDRSASEEVLSWRARESGLEILLTDSGFPPNLRPPGVPTVCFDADADAIGHCSGEKPANNPPVEQPACVLFSSGQSGVARGAVISHQALLNGSLAVLRQLDTHARDRVGFDMVLMLPALMSGAALVLPSRTKTLSSQIWLEWARSMHLTVAYLPTHFWHEIVLSLTRQTAPLLEKMRLMAVGGAPISPRALREWRNATSGSVPLVECYQLAETAGLAAFHLHHEEGGGAFQPAFNTRLRLFDANMEPVPIGVPGDLYVGGESLASGYLDGAGLSARCLVEDPLEPVRHLIKTGDCARFLEQGGIELVARQDDLARTEGFRLELCEARAIILEHAAVWDAVLIPQTAGGLITAYVISDRDPAPSPEDLLSHSHERLPACMIPSSFVVVDRLPLNHMGRIERAKLPPPPPSTDKGILAPRTLWEQKLASVWSGVLGLSQVGVRDNFFESGGDSLLAIQLCSKLKTELKLDLPARALFQHPTIEGLAAILSSLPAPSRRPEFIPLSNLSTGPTLVLMIGPGSLELFNLANLLREKTPIRASMSPLAESVIIASTKKHYAQLPSIEEMATVHAAMIKEQAPDGPLILTGYCFGGMLAFETARQLQSAGREVAGVVLLDTWMERHSWLWRRKVWLLGHLRRTLRDGSSYFWKKLRSRVKFERDRTTAQRSLIRSGNFGEEVPWVVTERIYLRAMARYRPKTLSCRGVLIEPKDDWWVQANKPRDPSLGAHGLFEDGLEVLEVPGNHITILTHLNMPHVAHAFIKALEILRKQPDAAKSTTIPLPKFNSTNGPVRAKETPSSTATERPPSNGSYSHPSPIVLPTPDFLQPLAAMNHSASHRTPAIRVSPIPGPPLFLIPGQNGTSIFPSVLVRKIGSLRLCQDGLEYPGMRGPEAPLLKMEEIASRLIDQIQQRSPCGPYGLCGYSFGGLMAYEMARQMKARGLEVDALILWEGYPHLSKTFFRRTFRDAMKELAVRLKRRDLPGRLRLLQQIVATKITVGSRKMRHIPWPFVPESPRDFVTRASLEAERNYQPQPYSGGAVLIKGQESGGIFNGVTISKGYGWKGLILGKLDIIDVPGSHLDLWEEPVLSILAQKTADWLKKQDDSETRAAISGELWPHARFAPHKISKQA